MFRCIAAYYLQVFPFSMKVSFNVNVVVIAAAACADANDDDDDDVLWREKTPFVKQGQRNFFFLHFSFTSFFFLSLLVLAGFFFFGCLFTSNSF
jgi:hypothetical protein